MTTESQIYTLERGKSPPTTVEVYELKQIIRQCRRTGQPLQPLIEELIDLSDGHDHSGIYRSVVFRTDRPISLHSLGFWGPQKIDQGKYDVKIIISELSSLTVKKQTKVVVSRFGCVAQARKGGVFMVPLHHSVHVTPGGWIQIEFQLNGPPTFRSEKMLSHCVGPAGVNFEFSDSSKQMPIIKYKIA